MFVPRRVDMPPTSAAHVFTLLFVLAPCFTSPVDAEEGRATQVSSLGNVSDDMQETAVNSPLSPDEEHVTFQLADMSLTIDLVAAEPDIVSPVAIAWDDHGRMFVAEMIGYPSTPDSGQIRRLEDRDGDGRYEHATVFADRISFPTSVLPYRDGVLVTAAPDILFLQDTDDDGVADQRRTDWTGFGADSQQLRSNALHWGIDNWIYGANGRCNGEVHRPGQDGKTVSIRARDFRFHPVTGEFQAITGLSQFGLAHDDWGNRFLSLNQVPIRHALIEQRYLSRGPQFSHQSVVNLASPNDLGRVFPISPTPQTFNDERADYYNAMCGLTILRGNGLGGGYRGDAFVCESLYNVVVRRKLVPSGPTFVSKRMEEEKEFLASNDSWFHPVFLATGPDGALYVVDFYRQFVEHPRYVSPELRKQFDWRNGYQHGRIWRIRHQDATYIKPSFDALTRADPNDLVAMLKYRIGWWRDTAQRLLIERGDKQAADPLRQLARRSDKPVARLHALWTLDGQQAIDDSLLIEALSDPDPRVRVHAIRLCEPRLQNSQPLQDALPALARDTDPRVRFQLALTCGMLPSPLRNDVLSDLVIAQAHSRWTTLAVLLAAGPEVVDFLPSLFRRQPAWVRSPDCGQVHFLIQAGKLLATAQDDVDLTKLINPNGARAHQVSADSPATLPRGHLLLLAGLSRGLAEQGKSLGPLLNNLAQRESGSAISAEEIARHAGKLLADPSASDDEREAAIELVAAGREQYAQKTLLSIIASPPRNQRLETAAIRVLSALNRPDLCARLYDDWDQSPLWYRRAVAQSSQQSAAAQLALVEALEGNVVVPLEVPLEVMAALRQIEGELAPRIRPLLIRPGSSDRERVIESYRPSADLPGDRRRGAQVFKQHCLACHTVERFGHAVGPDLAAVARRDQRELLVDILDPSRRVSPDFTGYALVTSSGKVLVGLIVAEVGANVTLRRENGESITVRRKDIDQLRATGQSLMPVGFEQHINVQNMADLMAFLKEPDRRLLEE